MKPSRHWPSAKRCVLPAWRRESLRRAKGVGEYEFASMAGIARSHMGKIERGEHMPTLALILKISAALSISAAELMSATERNLRADAQS